jgi:hypothetical protein
MSRERSPKTGKPYGLKRVCRVLEFPRSTLYAQQKRESAKVVPLHPRRRGPKPKLPDAELLSAIRTDLAASPSLERGTARSGRDCVSCEASAWLARVCCA